jgi:DNA polymerase IV (archaeal DinB-like DNA polymerase)
MVRFILHVDIDCFFAAVVLLDHPELKNKPLIIGPNPKKSNNRGVVLTCTYEARKFGIHSGMPVAKASRLCPNAVYERCDFDKIHEASKKFMEILQKYSSIFQKLGSDEAYLDITECVKNFQEAEKLAYKIKDEVKQMINITCSIGVSFTKMLAKIASDFNKPDGIKVFTYENFKDQLSPLPIKRIPGIGKKSKIYYNKKGIITIGDIISKSQEEIKNLFGKNGSWAWIIANGLSSDTVHDKNTFYQQKSISKERTFHIDVEDYGFIIEKLTGLNEKIHKSLNQRKINYKTISIKIRFKGYETYNRSKSFFTPKRNLNLALKNALELLEEFAYMNKPVRLIGLKFSNLSSEKEQIKKIQIQNIQKNRRTLRDFI